MSILISEVVTAAPATWMEHIALACSIVGVVIAWYVATRKRERRRIEPDPLNIRMRKATAKEEDCKGRYVTAMEALQALRDENRDEHSSMHDKIDEVENRADTKLTTALRDVNETIRKMPGEMVKLLRDTGQLKDHR